MGGAKSALEESDEIVCFGCGKPEQRIKTGREEALKLADALPLKPGVS